MEDGRENTQAIIDTANTLIQRRIIEHTEVKQLDEIITLDFIRKLLTSMVYYLKRNPETQEFYEGKFRKHKKKFDLCTDFLKKIRFHPQLRPPSLPDTWLVERIYNAGESLGNLQTLLRQVESQANDYFGSYLSDDESDNEEVSTDHAIEDEKRFFEDFQKALKRQKVDFNSINFLQWIESQTEHGVRDLFMAIALDLTNYDLPRQAKEDLDAINEALRDKRRINFDTEGRCILEGEKNRLFQVQTQFRFCFLRGVGYFDDRFNQQSRRAHRKYDEVGKPQFSEVVLRNVEGLDFYLNFPELRNGGEEFWEELHQNAKLLRTLLSNLRSSGYIAFRNTTKTYYLFDNIVDFLQYVQTNGIARFYKLVKAFLEEKDARWKKLFASFGNIFVPAGDLPIHAERYAFALKKPLNTFSLLPRYKKTGQPERPYIGKRYGILCSLGDMLTVEEPDHVWNLRFQKRVTVDFTIAPENEVSFLGLIPKGKVFFNSKARFPSFQKPYRSKFRNKYFLDEHTWKMVKERICTVAIHSQEEAKIYDGLMQWLILGNAVKFLWKACQLSNCANEKPNFFLIFKHPDGTLSHTFPRYEEGPAEVKRQKIAKHVFEKGLGIQILYKQSGQVYSANIEVREIQPTTLQQMFPDFVNKTRQGVSPSGQKYPVRKDSKTWLSTSPSPTSPSPSKKKEKEDDVKESPYKPPSRGNNNNNMEVNNFPQDGSDSLAEGMRNLGIFEHRLEAMVSKSHHSDNEATSDADEDQKKNDALNSMVVPKKESPRK